MQKYRIIMVLSVIALLNAAYLSYKAYFFRFIDPLGLTSFCDISKSVSCSEVLRHPLSNVFGIAFPWVALVVYPIILTLAWFGYKNQTYIQAKVLAALSFCGVCFNGLIIYREIRYIHAYCILCLICSAVIVLIFVLSLRLVKDSQVPTPAVIS